MIILTKEELAEALQCAFMEYYDLGPRDFHNDDERTTRKHDKIETMQERITEKVLDMCLKYPHVEWRLQV